MAITKRDRSGLALASVVAAALATAAAAAVIAAPGSEGARLIATGGGVTATYMGSTAFFENRVFLDNGDDDFTNDRLIFDNRSVAVGGQVDLGVFEPGEELVLRIDVVNNETRFFAGPASRNADGLPHARIETEWRPGKTLVSFEDLYSGPLNYDDFSLSVTNAVAEAPNPESAGFGPSGALAAALALLALTWRRVAA